MYISTGNEELDVKLQGGIPIPNLMIIEGPHGSSKTVVMQQFLYGALRSGLRAVAITTETTSVDYMKKMKILNFDVRSYIIRNKLRIYSLLLSEKGWGGHLERMIMHAILDFIERDSNEFEFLLIDSLTHIISPLNEGEILGFFTSAKKKLMENKILMFSLHPAAIDEKLASKIRALSDSYIKLSLAAVGGRSVKVMEIVKMKGSSAPVESTITFDVDPAFGIKLVPIALARA